MPEDSSISYLPTKKINVVKSEVTPNEAGPTELLGTNRVPNATPEIPVVKNFTPTRNALSPSVDVSEPTMLMTTLPSTRRPKDLEQALRTRCKQLGFSLFFHDHGSVRTLGFTSAIPGEGKTFMARLIAEVMAEDSGVPVTLLDCNWENPALSSAYNLVPNPGLADWLLGRCPLEAIRRQVTSNLTVIPAGDSSYNAAQLLRVLHQRGAGSVLTNPNELLVIDLPATVTTAYGPFAAQLADSLILVVRMGVTPESFVKEACTSLKDLHMHGIVFNQVTSRIPRWLRRIL
jgi:Mrp family chromosome partitioning ATPase